MFEFWVKNINGNCLSNYANSTKIWYRFFVRNRRQGTYCPDDFGFLVMEKGLDASKTVAAGKNVGGERCFGKEQECSLKHIYPTPFKVSDKYIS